jgi:hypothetical protein
MYYPMTRSEHVMIHREFGYGNGSGGYNIYYEFTNTWNLLKKVFGG